MMFLLHILNSPSYHFNLNHFHFRTKIAEDFQDMRVNLKYKGETQFFFFKQ